MDTESKSNIQTSTTPPATGHNQPETTSSTSPSKRGAKIIIPIIATILVLGVLAGGIGFIVSQKSKEQKEPQPTFTQTNPTPPTEEPRSEEEALAPGQKRYSSPKLGIDFVYQESQNNQTAAVKEEEDKIYVYIKELITDGKKDNYLGGQWVQIFSKSPSQSLDEAIKEKFLTDYSESDCFVSPYTNQSSSYPSSYETAVISYPPPTDESEPFWANAEKCPAIYTTTNGIAYFLMDKNNPDRFAFFNIGQYAILSSPGITWQSTVRFIPRSN